jgi:hypothetical protein
MKLSKYLSLLVSIIVLSAWSFRLNQPSVFRGGNAENMSEEFAIYGLSDSVMISVGVVKIILALLLLVGGLKYPALIKPSAAAMALFMIGAVYFHVSISDGIIPTLPAASLLLCCLLMIFSPIILGEKKS